MKSEDFLLLSKATFRIYKKSVLDSFDSMFRCWKYLFFHYLIVAACWLVSRIASFLPGIAGGFLTGMFLALFAAIYLASIQSAFNKDRSNFKELCIHGVAIFSPLVSFLFAFFVVQLIISSFLPSDGIKLLISLFITVILNPIPEIVQLRPALLFQMCADSFEFISENIVEWFLPLFLLLALVYLYNPGFVPSLFYIMSTNNPIDILQFLLINLGSSIYFLLSPLIFLVLVISYFLFLFRLNLFHALSHSTRRKRIYSERGFSCF